MVSSFELYFGLCHLWTHWVSLLPLVIILCSSAIFCLISSLFMPLWIYFRRTGSLWRHFVFFFFHVALFSFLCLTQIKSWKSKSKKTKYNNENRNKSKKPEHLLQHYPKMSTQPFYTRDTVWLLVAKHFIIHCGQSVACLNAWRLSLPLNSSLGCSLCSKPTNGLHGFSCLSWFGEKDSWCSLPSSWFSSSLLTSSRDLTLSFFLYWLVNITAISVSSLHSFSCLLYGQRASGPDTIHCVSPVSFWRVSLPVC